MGEGGCLGETWVVSSSWAHSLANIVCRGFAEQSQTNSNANPHHIIVRYTEGAQARIICCGKGGKDGVEGMQDGGQTQSTGLEQGQKSSMEQGLGLGR
ncbi:unnamed protein product [Gadus morhua 'NCC']